jgi:uncharacterized Tic20 family protein
MSGQQPTEPRRGRNRKDRADMPASFLPERNRFARKAYLCALFGLIPFAGLLLGPIAIFYGRRGYRDGKLDADGNGVAHSAVSMVLGGLETIAHCAGLPLVASGLGWI